MPHPMLTAFGLALATGADATIPIFLFAVLARMGVVPVAAPLDAVITSPVVLVALGVLATLDFISSRTHDPTVAALSFRVRQFVTMAAGGVLAATQSPIGSVDAATYALAGAGVASVTFHTRSGFRRVSPRLTPRVRWWTHHLGDGFAVVITLIALRHPHLLIGSLIWATVCFLILAGVVLAVTRKRLQIVMPALVALAKESSVLRRSSGRAQPTRHGGTPPGPPQNEASRSPIPSGPATVPFPIGNTRMPPPAMPPPPADPSMHERQNLSHATTPPISATPTRSSQGPWGNLQAPTARLPPPSLLRTKSAKKLGGPHAH